MEKPLNIWILNHYAAPPDALGGTRHFDLAEQRVKYGCRLTIFASAFGHQTRNEESAYGDPGITVKVKGGVQFACFKTFPYRETDRRRVVNMFTQSLKVGALALCGLDQCWT